VITREELYYLVWSEPMTKLAERFGVSGSYMTRVCKFLNVPRPERGHWAKLAVGKAGPQQPLPDPLPGDPLHWSKEGEPLPARKTPSAPRRRAEDKIKIPRSRVHGLVREARAHFENGRPVDDGAYLKPYKKLLLDVTTSMASLDKALSLANDLFNALVSVGHRVVIASSDSQLRHTQIDEREDRRTPRDSYYYSRLWSPQRPTVTFVGDVAIGLAIVEMSEQVLLRYVHGKYIREADYVPPKRYGHDYSWTTTRELPSGRFRVVAYSPYSRVDWALDWQETRRSSLRSAIRDIVKAIEDAAPELVARLEEADRRAEIAHQEWLAAQERRRREEDRQQIEKSIQDSKTHLAEVIQQWANVMSVEQFFAGVERRAAELPDDEQTAVFERLSLARKFLGSQDPLNFFRSWKTPEERYRTKYPEEAGNWGPVRESGAGGSARR